MVTSTNRPTDRPTNRQGEYRAICLFRKLENRKKAEICNINGKMKMLKVATLQLEQKHQSKTTYNINGKMELLKVAILQLVYPQKFEKDDI